MRQYFDDNLAVVPVADLTAVTATTETALWPVASYTTIGANGDPDGPLAGKVWRVTAGGLVTTGASGGLTITPRYGTSTGGVSLGATLSTTVTINQTNVPWSLTFMLVCRATSTTASSSTFVGSGHFDSIAVTQTAGGGNMNFGGTTVTTADTTVRGGFFIGWTLSVAGSVTPKYVVWEALN